MLSNDLKSKINWLWDRFWAGGLSNPITAIEQISYLLFMRRLELVDGGKFFKGKENLKWSQFKNLPPNELYKHIKNKVFPFIKNLQNSGQPFSMAMESAVFMIEKPTLLKEAIAVIDDIYADIEQQQQMGQHFQDTQGDLYEYLLKATSEAGKNGQFRTPRHIIQMMCEMVDPSIGDKICDLTCGTAGFLVGAYQHILSKHSTKKSKIVDENGFERSLEAKSLSSRQKDILKSKTFYGFDIDPTMIRIGLMNLMMHGITQPQISRIDTLSGAYEQFENSHSISKENIVKTLTRKTPKKDISDERYTVILANPPFTGRIDKSMLSPKLNRIDSSQSELLFLHRIIYMLKPQGKAAVIIPEGVLFGTAKAQRETREILLRDCQLDAVISLPSGVFQPYTGVKTSILIFTKKKLHNNSFSTKKVWFYGMQSDGYTLDSNRKKLKENPLPVVVHAYQQRNRQKVASKKSNHFFVTLETIQKNGFELSYNQYKKFVYEQHNYEPPKELLKRALDLEKELLNEMNELNNML